MTRKLQGRISLGGFIGELEDDEFSELGTAESTASKERRPQRSTLTCKLAGPFFFGFWGS